MAVQPLPPDARSRIARGRRRARARAQVLAAFLALAGIVCVAFGVSANPAPASAQAPRVVSPAAVTPLMSARRVPALFVDAVAVTRLNNLIGAVVAPVDACVTVEDRSTPLVGINPQRSLAGASTQKVLVAAAALSVLGDDYHFTTRVVSAGTVDGGVLTGDLVVVGGGDPMLTTASDPGPAATPLSGLADAIVQAGITQIDGALVAEDSRYDRERSNPEWTAGELDEGSSGALGALVVNGGYEDGEPADDPALDTVEQLADLLSERDVEITDGTSHSDDTTAADADEIAHVDSPPLPAIVEEMLTVSNNETAELLTRELGFERSGTGTTATGTQAVKIALAHLGVPVTGVELHDGSGLAPTNRVTCAALMHVIELSSRTKLAAVDRGLPIAGQTGTLAPRFTGTPLAGRLRAKTGHIDGVVGLTGLVDAATGSDVAPRFAFLANGTFSTSEGEQLQDQIGAVIGAYPDAPTPAELVPAPESSGDSSG
jgi:D-alanyl-D-alanine carboxypeptidase/D-alanyl-D-alanine-endopeptidase (penicillin-binding protein 4)